MTQKLPSSFREHIQISYGEAKSSFRQSPEDKWNLTIGTSPRPMVDWRAEVMLAAVQIFSISHQHPLLFVDGSYASQIMVQAFRWSKGEFTCVVPRFLKDLNLPAFSQAIVFLENTEVPYEIIDVDLEALLADPETMNWVQKYSTDLPIQLVAMKVWQQLAARQLPVIFPMGLPNFRKTPEGWKVMEYEKDYGLHLFQKEHQLVGVPSFFKWSPEALMGLLLDPTLRALMTNVRRETAITDKIWKEIFQNYFPISGERSWTGFEKTEFLLKRFHQNAKAAYQGNFTAFAFPFADYSARLNYNKPVANMNGNNNQNATPPQGPTKPKVKLA